MDEIFALLESHKKDIKTLASHAGLHRLDEDKKRFESWMITSAKLYALNHFRDALLKLPPLPTESDDLLFQKLNSSLFRDFLKGRIDSLTRRICDARDQDGEPVISLDLQICLAECMEILKAFDDLGNAGEHPKDEEEGGRKVEDAYCARPSILELLKVAGSFDLSPRNLHAVSEWCLDELEKHGNADTWQIPAFGEGAEIRSLGRS